MNLPPEITARLIHLQRENERLHRRASQFEAQLRSLLVLQGVANTLSAELDLAPLLRRIAMAAVRLCAADVSVLYLLDAAGTSLSVGAVETAQSVADTGAFSALDYLDIPALERISEHAPQTVPLGTIPLGQGLVGRAAATGEFILVSDAAHDHRFTSEDLALDIKALGLMPGQMLVVPMLYKGKVTGALEVAQSPQHIGFDAHSLDFVRTLAAQAAIAVANAQLYQHLRDERDHVIQAQEDERKRLGRDLHDGPAQKLAQIAMTLEHAEQAAAHEPEQVMPALRSARDLAMQTSRNLRNLLFDLHPLILESQTGGLVAALAHFIARFSDTPAPRIRLDAQYDERLAHNAEVTVFAILQEAVNNVLKHAHAQNCVIELRERPGGFLAVVRDDGAGFDMRAVQTEYESRGSWGLVSMLERAALIEARLTVSSQPGKGTMVSLEVPR
jgi:signal transduction histidine kinase